MSGKTVLTDEEIFDLMTRSVDCCDKQANKFARLIEAAVLAAQPQAGGDGAKDAEIIAAAKNLVAVKGRYHIEQAYKRLAAAIATQSTEGAKG